MFTCILKVLAKTLPNFERQEERVAKVFDVRESPPLFQCKTFTFQSFSLKLLLAFYLLFSNHFVFLCILMLSCYKFWVDKRVFRPLFRLEETWIHSLLSVTSHHSKSKYSEYSDLSSYLGFCLRRSRVTCRSNLNYCVESRCTYSLSLRKLFLRQGFWQNQ